MTLSFVLRKLNGGGPSQVKGVIRVLKSHNGIEICLSLRVLELGKSWIAIILDNRNGEDCYPLFCRNWFSTLQHDLSTGSVIMV